MAVEGITGAPVRDRVIDAPSEDLWEGRRHGTLDDWEWKDTNPMWQSTFRDFAAAATQLLAAPPSRAPMTATSPPPAELLDMLPHILSGEAADFAAELGCTALTLVRAGSALIGGCGNND